MILTKEFYCRDTEIVAKELLGKLLVREINGVRISGIITETEAYFGLEDPASHARFGKTDRNFLMFDEGGKVYVYLIYGMYNCLNFTTDKKDVPGAVLIRSILPYENIEYMKEKRNCQKYKDIANGPGKLCIAFSINRDINGLKANIDSGLYVEDKEIYKKIEIKKSKRIGIKKDLEKDYRFYIEPNF